MSEKEQKSEILDLPIAKPTHKRTAIVVGGSSGIGCETCLRLVNHGWSVTNISRSSCPSEKVKNINADVTAGNAVGDAICAVAKKNGLHALIYCAANSMAAPIEFAKECDIKYLFEVNYFGAIKAVQAALPYLKKSGGKIILVGSLGGDIPIVFDSFYSSSKAALQILAKSLHGELKPYGVKACAILPGGTATGFTFKRKVYSEEDNKTYAKSVNKAVAALAHFEQSGMNPAVVAERIYKALVAENPSVIKTVGAKNVAFRYASRVLPERLTLYLNNKVFNQ